MRIGAGRFKGRILPVASHVRPTGGRVREALFDVIGPRLIGARVLDLFAGSGSLGLEALSRGASHAVLAESDARLSRELRRVARELAGGAARVFRLHLPRELGVLAAAGAAPFDLILADPPYGFRRLPELLAEASQLLAPGGVLVLEHGEDDAAPDAAGVLVRSSVRRYGDSALSFYERAEP